MPKARYRGCAAFVRIGCGGISPVPREGSMPMYVFLCKDCNKEFNIVLRISELEKGNVKCPHCGSGKVEQQVAAFSAVTSKKS
jgi:putative FmdB family regulatory protein